MIQVKNVSGQLGNRLLRLNNALQLSKKLGKNIKLKGKDDVTKDIFNNFDFDLGKYSIKGKNIDMNGLGELFFKNDYDPKDLIKIKSGKQIRLDKNKTNVGIHIRYPPKVRGNKFPFTKDEKLLEEYYINSIKECVKELKNVHFIIFGPVSKNQFRWEKDNDQLTAFITKFDFYKKMIRYMEDNKIDFSYSITINDNNEHYMKDFIQMCNCDVLISSYSTFSICAGFLEKEKKIIYSKKIVEFYVKQKDKFWVDLYSGGNKYYKIWKLI